MMHPAVPIAVLALAAPAADQAARGGVRHVVVTQMTVRERVIVRVPRMAPGRVPLPDPVVWKERKGPKCIAVQDLAGMIVYQARAIDLVLTGGRRVRAKLDGNCSSLGYYAGFYIRPAADGMVCSDRDVIRVRSGGSCEIDSFKSLVPKR